MKPSSIWPACVLAVCCAGAASGASATGRSAARAHVPSGGGARRLASAPGRLGAARAVAAAREAAPANILADGGFESGRFGAWLPCGDSPSAVLESTVVHSGAYAVQTGSAVGEPDGDVGICQQVAVPAGGVLTFWSRGATNETNEAYADQEASILAADGTVLKTLYSTLDGRNVWTRRRFDLSAYAGRTVVLYFGVHGSGAPAFHVGQYIDDVLLAAGPVAPVTAPAPLFVVPVAVAGTAVPAVAAPTVAPVAAAVPAASPIAAAPDAAAGGVGSVAATPGTVTPPSAVAQPVATAQPVETAQPAATVPAAPAVAAPEQVAGPPSAATAQPAAAAPPPAASPAVVLAYAPATACDDARFVALAVSQPAGYHEVSVCGTVVRVAAPPGRGERVVFTLRLDGARRDVDVTANVAETGPFAVKVGDRANVLGRYFYDNAKSQGIDWTHHNEPGASWPYPGYVQINGGVPIG